MDYHFLLTCERDRERQRCRVPVWRSEPSWEAARQRLRILTEQLEAAGWRCQSHAEAVGPGTIGGRPCLLARRIRSRLVQ